MSTSFALLLPVKPWHRAKSRLGHEPAVRSADFARAFALDAIAAAQRCPAVGHVYVVTAQAGFLPAGSQILPDEGSGDLNAALRTAVATLRERHPRVPVAAMCADLPSLRAADLTEALDEVARYGARSFVADADGTGTTLLAAVDGDLTPLFGAGSARRHLESGAAPVTAAAPSLRRDVDTLDDLEQARALGVGPHTRALLSSLEK